MSVSSSNDHLDCFCFFGEGRGSAGSGYPANLRLSRLAPTAGTEDVGVAVVVATLVGCVMEGLTCWETGVVLTRAAISMVAIDFLGCPG